MELSYDLHIHTALSPCGDEDMTPNNIVNMAVIKGLDIIAITDHNTCGNASAVMEAARNLPLTVVPGMEVETAEAIHVVCLFPRLENALAVEKVILNSLPPIKNRKDIYGPQLFMDAKDEVIGEQEQLLVISSGLSVNELEELVWDNQGAAVPAHVDRESYSVTASLGGMPQDLRARFVEVSKAADLEKFLEQYPEFLEYSILRNSDAHYLENISEREQLLELPENTAASLLQFLRGNL